MDLLTRPDQLAGWTPIRVDVAAGPPRIQWCFTDGVPFTHPFFAQSVDICLQEPFRLLFQHSTTIDELEAFVGASPGLPPTGFIFHMSRCGSTLLAQMLAAMTSNSVLSEPGPLDAVLRWRGGDEDQRVAWLRAMVAAMGQPRSPGQRRLFVKFDSWSVLELPTVRRAFPEVPWLFVYRDPVEVLVSHAGHRGAHMIPGVVPPGDLGFDPGAPGVMPVDEYGARALAALCAAALRHADDPMGGLVNHCELPDRALADILPAWVDGMTPAEQQAASAVTGRDAKNPFIAYEPDAFDKQARATPELRATADAFLVPLYEQLEAARAAQVSRC